MPMSASNSAHTGTSGQSAAMRSKVARSGWTCRAAAMASILSYGWADTREPRTAGPGLVGRCDDAIASGARRRRAPRARAPPPGLRHGRHQRRDGRTRASVASTALAGTVVRCVDSPRSAPCRCSPRSRPCRHPPVPRGRPPTGSRTCPGDRPAARARRPLGRRVDRASRWRRAVGRGPARDPSRAEADAGARRHPHANHRRSGRRSDGAEPAHEPRRSHRRDRTDEGGGRRERAGRRLRPHRRPAARPLAAPVDEPPARGSHRDRSEGLLRRLRRHVRPDVPGL